MEFELWDESKGKEVTYTPARIAFPAMDFYMDQARKLADYISTMTVTEENVKEVKATLANARKVIKRFDDGRIRIKKEILSDYDTFADQIKAITAVIDEADGEVRAQVKELDEKEREAKKSELKFIWGSRCEQYPYFIDTLDPEAFDHWLTPQMLNKNTSLSAASKDMLEWLEKSEKELKVLQGMGDEYVVAYLGCRDMAEAIKEVKEKEEITERINKAQEEEDEYDPPEEVQKVFIIEGEKNIKLVELLLESNDIEYVERNI